MTESYVWLVGTGPLTYSYVRMCVQWNMFYIYIYIQTHTCTHTYFLTSWSRVLHEELTDLQPVKNFHSFYGLLKFVTAFTSVRHLSLSWTTTIQSLPPHPNSRTYILILSSLLLLGLPSGLIFPAFHTKKLHTPLPSSYALHAPPISFS